MCVPKEWFSTIPKLTGLFGSATCHKKGNGTRRVVFSLSSFPLWQRTKRNNNMKFFSSVTTTDCFCQYFATISYVLLFSARTSITVFGWIIGPLLVVTTWIGLQVVDRGTSKERETTARHGGPGTLRVDGYQIAECKWCLQSYAVSKRTRLYDGTELEGRLM